MFAHLAQRDEWETERDHRVVGVLVVEDEAMGGQVEAAVFGALEGAVALTRPLHRHIVGEQ